MFKMKLPKDVEFILEKIESAGYESFVVGGCVRDQLVNYYHNTNYKIKDYDITTNCSYDKLEEIFKGFSMKTVGKSFGVLIIKMNGVHYEIALYREDGEYKDNRRPSDVKFTNNSKIDCGRRDFSVNSVLYSPKTGVIDYFNGIEDIKKLELKFIGNASNRLDEDMLRYMRMYRFATKYRMDYPVIDNTNMKRKYRKKFIQDAKSKGYRVTGVQFNTPLEVCLKRGKQTNFPSDVLMKFFSNRQPLKYEEEFDNIIIKEGGSDDE